tara:strand:+ start:680 stop:1141 length:462 start_codon:yes stop_codon:yes gene_type:complete
LDEKYQIDSVDRQILNFLMTDARTPYLEIARKLIVSGGTIHQRVERMKTAGIITGSSLNLSYKNLGYDVTVFLGIHLTSSKELGSVIKQLSKLPEVVEAHYTTGNYALLLKVLMRNISDFHYFLANKIQEIEAVRATESFISLDQPIQKDISF